MERVPFALGDVGNRVVVALWKRPARFLPARLMAPADGQAGVGVGGASPVLRGIEPRIGTAGELADDGNRVLPGRGSLPVPALGWGRRGGRRGRVLGRTGAAGPGRLTAAGHVVTGSRAGRTTTVSATRDDLVGRHVGAPRAVAQPRRREMTSVCMVLLLSFQLLFRDRDASRVVTESRDLLSLECALGSSRRAELRRCGRGPGRAPSQSRLCKLAGTVGCGPRRSNVRASSVAGAGRRGR
jgi:hypothetical protein